MVSSSLLMGLIGITIIFLPDETANFLGLGKENIFSILLQLLGAAYFAFAALNWMAKENLIGGIYNRPITVGNFTHFFVGGLALIKGIFVNQNILIIWILSFLYLLFAFLFGILLFRHPSKKEEQKDFS